MYLLLLLFHVWSVNQPTIMGMVICHEKPGHPWFETKNQRRIWVCNLRSVHPVVTKILLLTTYEQSKEWDWFNLMNGTDFLYTWSSILFLVSFMFLVLITHSHHAFNYLKPCHVLKLRINVKQSRYRPGVVQMVPGS